MNTRFTVKTSNATEIVNITQSIRESIVGAGSGLLYVSVPHTTAALFLGEDDLELREDIVKIVTETLVPLRPFKHIRKQNPNTEAHVFSSLFGTNLTLRVQSGLLVLGTYQNVLLLELDGPKERTVELDLLTSETIRSS
jgi:secondary thiamine-phosphate synthase enzyme